MQVITSWTGGHADALRQSLRLTNESFAEYLGVGVRTVANWRKNPKIIPQPRMQDILDATLDKAPDRAKAQFAALTAEASSHVSHAIVGVTAASLGAFGACPNGIPAIPSRTAEEDEEEEMERRRLLQSLAVLGLDVSSLSRALETVRTVFGNSVGYDERLHLDDWEEVAVEYGYSYMATSSVDLIPDLVADLVTVRSVMRMIPGKDGSEYRSWCRIGGTLSGLMAKTTSNLGQSRESRHWWNMAQHLADTSGDLELQLWVRGERIIHGLYENRPVPLLSRQAESAMEFAPAYPCAGLVNVSGGQAQVSILAGDYGSAQRYLHRTEEILGRIPAAATSSAGSVMGWGESELRYTEAWVYSYMGNEVEADRAAERALSLYPESYGRGPAQIKLMQAFARVQRGDISEGIRCAQAVYGPLVSGQLATTMIKSLALRVLNSVPVEERNRSDVAEYRILVESPLSRDRETFEA